MPYEIEFVQDARDNLKALRRTDQVKVLDQIEQHLSADPTRFSRSRIKRLRNHVFPPYRLRVDEFRIYYDVVSENQTVVVYGIVSKSESEAWLSRRLRRRVEEP